MPMIELLAMFFQLVKLFEVKISKAVLCHDELEHSRRDVELPQMIDYSTSNKIHSLHIFHFCVDFSV
jgi:hypothetical protein